MSKTPRKPGPGAAAKPQAQPDPKATPEQPWFLTTALMIASDGRPTAIAGLAPAADERTARLEFTEQLLEDHGARGWAVREVTAAQIPHRIVPALPPEGT